jgi:hypothetical protein
MCTSPSSASARNACRPVPGFSPWSLARSGTDGRVSPEVSCPERIAARTRSAACCHSSRGSAGSGLRSGMLRRSVNGLPVHARFPHRISRAYNVSSSGPRTLRTCMDPRAGLMVRRIYHAGGARTHDRRIMRGTAPRTVRTTCTDTTEPCHDGPDCTDGSVHEPVHGRGTRSLCPATVRNIVSSSPPASARARSGAPGARGLAEYDQEHY